MSSVYLEQMAQAKQFLERELAGIRTGRANPNLIEDLPVECYGTRTPLQQLASISAPEPQLLVVQPWDLTILKDLEKALSQSKLGITPVVDSNVIRLPFPPMTEERRKELLKTVHQKSEETRVRIRRVREEHHKFLKRQEKDGELSEDEVSQQTKQLQEAVDRANIDIDSLVDKKSQELMTV